MLIHIFDFYSKTPGQIHFKLGRGVPWVGLYHVCSNGHGPVIFGLFMTVFVDFFVKMLKNLLLRNSLTNCFEITQGYTWGHLHLNFFHKATLLFFSIFLNEFLYVFTILDFFSRTVAQVVLKLGGNVPCRWAKQNCSLGGVNLDS